MVGEGVWVRLPKVVCFSIGVLGGGVGLETSLVGLIGLRVLCRNYACLSVCDGLGRGVWVRLPKVVCFSAGVFGGGVGLETSFGGLIGLRVSQCML